MDVSVSSIATYLPSSTENDNKAFGGTIHSGAIPTPALTPAEEIARRVEEVKKHAIDAETRRVVWAADPNIEDEQRAENVKPTGIREDDGTISALPFVQESVEERHFFGVSQPVPQGLMDIQHPNNFTPASGFPQTQLVNDHDAETDIEFREAWQQIPGREMRRQVSAVSDTFSLGESLGGDSMLETPTPCPTKRSREVLPRSPADDSIMSPLSSVSRTPGRVVSIEMKAPDEEAVEKETDELMKKLALSHVGGVDKIEDEEMLGQFTVCQVGRQVLILRSTDLETQIVDSIDPQLIRTPTLDTADPIESFKSNEAPSPAPASPPPVLLPPVRKRTIKTSDEVVECECGIQVCC